MTNLYAVVGEQADDPNRLLVLGEDGQYYDWDLTSEQTRPVEPGAEWHLDGELLAGEVAFDEVFLDPKVQPACPPQQPVPSPGAGPFP